jgi:hypothetical protein
MCLWRDASSEKRCGFWLEMFLEVTEVQKSFDVGTEDESFVGRQSEIGTTSRVRETSNTSQLHDWSKRSWSGSYLRPQDIIMVTMLTKIVWVL